MALKTYNPVTPGTRELVQVDRSKLWKGKPVKKLTVGLSKSGGRNNYGRITAAYRRWAQAFLSAGRLKRRRGTYPRRSSA